MQQLALPLATRDMRDEVNALCLWLKDRDWCSAMEISFEFPSWRDRKIRAIASASEGRIMSGQQGYKLTLDGNFQEVHHASAWLISQGKDMIRRGIRIRRVYHEGRP